ncbi:MAG: hypothetical protein MPI95_05775 [Nitrosopumilus sp.]|nr:hypothetical protein [Nitrosopumilus sp.]MDA7944007.1 hypothetical protein [Nitrosopumilus sp.]MDA7944964.1 hypothetical protein [Nitrosopumilus sp.]MDA7955520.1 hypothetical protein [Nitrosopumilus sp.]MDA7958578.1 hypothetical protein [Nitrosopumilus sp.]
MGLCNSCYRRNIVRDMLCQTCLDSGASVSPRSAACSNCGRRSVASLGRCSACYQYYRTHGIERPLRNERAAAPPGEGCSNCGAPNVIARGRCSACYRYFNRHGRERDPDGRVRAPPPPRGSHATPCSVCSRPGVVSRGRCSSCYQYFNKHGRDRDPDRLRALIERALRPAARQCSNCGKNQVTSKGRCAACYQYLRTHGIERDPAGMRVRAGRDGRREKESCVNGCELEPRTWAEGLWSDPYYGSRPKITAMVGGHEEDVESGWLCATHYARWKKYACTEVEVSPGTTALVYARGPWICRGRVLYDPGPCAGVPMKLDRDGRTGELDCGRSKPDDLDIFLDGLCQDCRNAEHGVIYERAVGMAGDPHPRPDVMIRALSDIMREMAEDPGPQDDA